MTTVNVEQIERELQLLSLYAAGWDGYQADTPRGAALDDARRFARSVDQGVYRVEPCPDGAVSLCATFNGARRIYDFEGDSHCTVTELMGDGGGWVQIAYFPI